MVVHSMGLILSNVSEGTSNMIILPSKGPSVYDVHTEGGRGSGSGGRMWTGGRGVKNLIFCGRHKWMTPKLRVCDGHSSEDLAPSLGGRTNFSWTKISE